MLYEFAGFELDPGARELRHGGERVDLQPKVFDLLLHLVRNRHQVVTRDELFAALWPDTVVSEDALFHALKKARAALRKHGADPQLIETVPRVGYRFVAGVAERQARAVQATGHPGEGPLIGREVELVCLNDALHGALAGAGRIAVVSGEAGIGKSRLAMEVAREARARGAAVHEAAAWEGSGAPAFWLWVQIVRSIAESRTLEGFQQAADPALEELARLAPEAFPPAGEASEASTQGAVAPGALAPDVRVAGHRPAPPDFRDSDRARFRLMDAVSGFLVRAARERPHLLVLEDLHWAQPTALQLLAFLSGRLAAAPILVLATFRTGSGPPEDRLAATLAACEQHALLLRLPLAGFDTEEVGSLVEALSGSAPPAAVSAALHDATGGNPFFVKQLVSLTQSRADVPIDFALRLESTVEALPATVRPVLERRLSSLSEHSRELLLTASVIGAEWSLPVLARVSSLRRESLLAALEEARRARLIACGADGQRWQFVHGLVREAAYATLSESARVRIHRAVAAALEDLHKGSLGSVVSELAHHYGRASLVLEGDEAVRYAKWAGDLAVAALSYEEAAAHYERALDAANLAAEPVAEARRAEILVAAGYANHNAGALERGREQLHRAAELAILANEPQLLAYAALGHAEVGVGIADPESMRLLEAALAALGEGTDFLRVWLRSTLASYLVGQHEQRVEAERLVAEAEAGARSIGDARALAYALCARGDLLRCHPDECLDTRVRVLEEAEALASSAGDGVLEMFTLLQRRGIGVERGDLGELDALARRCDALTERLRSGFWNFAPLTFRLLPDLLAGRFAKAEKELARGLSSPDVPRLLNTGGMLGGGIGAIRYHQGRLAEVLPMLEGAAHNAPHLVVMRAGYVLALADAGDESGARRQLDALARNGFEALAGAESWVFAAVLLADACVSLGARDAARSLTRLLASRAGHCVSVANAFYCHGPVALYLARLAMLLEDQDAAGAHLDRALEMAERLDSPVWRAQVLATRARASGVLGDAEAREAAREAAALAGALGMQPR